jgi:hypothetical protein
MISLSLSALLTHCTIFVSLIKFQVHWSFLGADSIESLNYFSLQTIAPFRLRIGLASPREV